MTEQGAAADNACRRWSAWRRRALLRGSRVSQDAQAGLANRPKGASQAPGRLPALHSPRVEGKRKTGTKGPPRGPKSKPRDSEALAEVVFFDIYWHPSTMT